MTKVSYNITSLNGTKKTVNTFKEAQDYKAMYGGKIETVYTELQESHYNGAESNSKIIKRKLV